MENKLAHLSLPIDIMHKSLLFLFLFILPMSAFCQTEKKNVHLEIINYTDTIVNELSSVVNLRLTNTSDSIIFVSNRLGINMIAIRQVKNKIDTINTEKIMQHADINYISLETIQELRPNESKDYQFYIIGWITKKGPFKIKFYLRIDELNMSYNVAQTNWISLYCNLEDNEFIKK